VWLNVGRLHPAKGLVYLIDAFALIVPAHPKMVLLVAGRGPQLDELERRARSRGVTDQIRFLGERSDVLALIDAADGLVFPSLSEGLPVSVLEAMAMQKACVASRIGPHEELIADRESGMLVALRDSDSLAAAMAAVQNEPALASGLAHKARRRATEEFDARRGADRLTELYVNLCRE
jgi:glycosyltransferase involved in cell wall biosynthesis